MTFDNNEISNKNAIESTIKDAYIIDSHPLICEGFHEILMSIFKDINIKKCSNIDNLKKLDIKNTSSSLIIIDIFNVSCNSLQELINLKTSYPKAKILIATNAKDEDLIERCMSLGAIGFLPKSTTTVMIKKALKNIARNIQWIPRHLIMNSKIIIDEQEAPPQNTFQKIDNFTQKELLTLRHLIDGLVNRDIAKNLNVTESTTKSHVSSIIKKMGVYNRTQVFCEFKKLNQKSIERNNLYNKI